MISYLVVAINHGRVILLCSLVFVCALGACAHESDMILALRDVQSFDAHEFGTSPMTIRLSGLAFHSSLAVRNVSVAQNGSSLQVLVHLTPATAGLSGNFTYDLVVPESINTVIFGNEMAVIWRRDAGL